MCCLELGMQHHTVKIHPLILCRRLLTAGQDGTGPKTPDSHFPSSVNANQTPTPEDPQPRCPFLFRHLTSGGFLFGPCTMGGGIALARSTTAASRVKLWTRMF
jgi:hypothetical protein